MSELPSGTVTFLFTDIEGSTRLAQEQPAAMPALLARHNDILTQCIEAQRGFIFRVVGDSFAASFHDALDALRAALDAQKILHSETWTPAPIKVRMGIHTGAAQLNPESKENPYSGYATLALTQRIMSASHGGQILLSQSTYELTRDWLPENAQLTDMGERRLKDVLRPERIYQLTTPELSSEFPPLNTLETFPHNLPNQLTSFVGREKEITEIKALLAAARLVTLTGSGGTGKTRLALEIGAAEMSSFLSGVWVVELAPLTDAAQILAAIAEAFGLQEQPFTSLPTLVMDYLRDKKALLILDNCEHLIEACARIASDLLQHCPQLKILASSREALGIAGERTFHTPSLAVPESMHLFVERARAVNPKFDLTESNAAAVSQICSRLDGIPLAIELAAARARLLSPEQIAARLDDRFRLLIGGSRTALPRQQTLRALIDWSYDLLSEAEKTLFRTASVFVGGWTLDALETVANDPDVLEHLEQLVNKSLVVTEEREGEMRYFMLETIRQYAREKLFDAKEASAARDRHFAYFDALAENIWSIFQMKNLIAWRRRAEDETENLRAAIEWGQENFVEQALRLAANFCLLTGWIGSRQDEGLTSCRIAIDRVKSLPPVTGTANTERQRLLARALFAQGMVGLSNGNMLIVLQDLREAIDIARLAGDKRVLGYSLEMYFTATMFLSAPGGVEAADEGYRIFREEVDDLWGLSMAYQNQGRIATMRGDQEQKEKYFAEFRELIREAPLSFQAGLFYLGAGMSEVFQGNDKAAKTYFEEGVHVFKHIQNWSFQLVLTSELGHIARRTGDISDAKRIYRETLRDWQNLGNRGAIANQLECFAFLAMAEEEPERAAKLLGAAELLREKAQSPMTDFEKAEYEHFIAQLRSMLPQHEIIVLWAEGRGMTMAQAIQQALASD